MPGYDSQSFGRGIAARIAMFLLDRGSDSAQVIVSDVDREHRNFYKFFKNRDNVLISKDKDRSSIWIRRRN